MTDSAVVCSRIPKSLENLTEPTSTTTIANSDHDTLKPFLTRHVPNQLSSNPRKPCYRHRPDIVKRRMPDEITLDQVQKQMELLPNSDQAAITHIWTLFSAAPAQQRLIILEGLLTTCCMPQLSFLSNAIKPLLRIDFISVLTPEISFKILSYLDAKSLCHAAQVCKRWKALADDDVIWHKMCEQHIDKKCNKCGWGLPLLDKKKSCKRPISTTVLASPSTPTPSSPPSPTVDLQQVMAIRNVCGANQVLVPNHPMTTTTPYDSGHSSNDEVSDDERPSKRARMAGGCQSMSSSSSGLFAVPQITIAPTRAPKRPWKEIYSERLMVERNWRKNKYTSRVLSGHTDGVMCLQYDDSSNVLITGSYDKTVRVWNLETGKTLRVLAGHTRCVRALQFDEAKLITGSMDNTLRIWNYHTGQCIRTLEGHTKGIICLHFDCRILVSGSADTTIKVWDFGSGECYTLCGHTDWVNSVRIFQKTTIVSGSDDTTIRFWDLNTRSCVRVLQGHVGQVQSVVPSMHGFTHRFFDQASKKSPKSHSNVVQQQQLHQLQQISSVSATATLHANNVHQVIEIGSLTASDSSPPSLQAADSDTSDTEPGSDESRSHVPVVVSGSLDNTIKFWCVQSGKCLRTLFGHIEGVWALAYDKLRVVSGSHDNSVKVWDIDSGRCMHTLEGHMGPVTAVALGDTKIISASDDGDVRVWDYGVRS
ncbi:quinon protein alcohol dehydrogenase-like superfamily [Jimgerdemannia flammicorona]|uniref:Quinon protein alcohol dehydrogenase-like superfamily n=1 Tax=Jimgerdemannia flammicorona TaxID=994334 RepID=A0A433D2A0_9FUNG|nr:quinon protein alcohol dehydrogenase-like superfamily [Jimgerdemannia flammicorona]